MSVRPAGDFKTTFATDMALLDTLFFRVGFGLLLVGLLLAPHLLGRYLFLLNTIGVFAIGAIGSVWVLFWLSSVRSSDLALPTVPPADPLQPATWSERWPMLEIVRQRRFWILVVLVIAVNLTWHFFRVWLPKFLQQRHGYTEKEMLMFTSAYYFAADVGSLTAGFVSLYLARRGLSVFRARFLVYLACTLLTSLSVAVAFLDRGPVLLALLLVIAMGALGLYPPYYSFSQDLTVRHQGKVSGTLGFSTWVASALMQPLVGKWLDYSGKNYTPVVAVAGLFPLFGLAALLFWGRKTPAAQATPTPTSPMPEPVTAPVEVKA